MEIAHLLNLPVMVPYPGIQLFHKPLVGIWLVIINRPEKKKSSDEKEVGEKEKPGDKGGGHRILNNTNWPLSSMSF